MIDVFSSIVLNVDIDTVWARAKEFNGLPNWHPGATDSHIEDNAPNGAVGCIRNFALTDGSGRIRETLLEISDTKRTLTYDMLPGGALPFVDYVSTMRFYPVTDTNQTFATWSARFDVSDGQHDHWKQFVGQDVFIGGLKALEESFG